MTTPDKTPEQLAKEQTLGFIITVGSPDYGNDFIAGCVNGIAIGRKNNP